MSSMIKQQARKPAPERSLPDALCVCQDYLLGSVSETVTSLLDEALGGLGIRLRHYRLLRLLHYSGPQAQGNVGALLGVDRTTVVGLVDFLEQRGLAKRERSKEDRRAYMVRVTPKGARLTVKATEVVTAEEARMFAPLDDRERELLRHLSTRLLAEPGPIAEAHARYVSD